MAQTSGPSELQKGVALSPSSPTVSSDDDEATMEVERAFHLARFAHRVGFTQNKPDDLREAEILYRRLLDIAPDHPGVLHFFGVLLHQTQRSDEGIRAIRRSLELDPQQDDAWANLGNVYLQCGQFDQAVDAYQHALAIRPQHVAIQCMCGRWLVARGRYEEAMDAYSRALAQDSNCADAHQGMAECLSQLGRHPEALRHAHLAQACDPTAERPPEILCQVLHAAGEHDEAMRILRKWLKSDPDNPVAQHLLSAWSQEKVPERAPDGYIREVFDEMAPHFDSSLSLLDYRAPQLAIDAVTRIYGEAKGSLDVLDAGCGTGLVGPGLRPYAKALTGVDLSQKMLQQAAQRRVYDYLIEGELTAVFRSMQQALDLVTCVDTFCYFGDLKAPLQALAGALRPQGHLVFTVERREDGDVHLEEHGRYAHSESHIRTRAAEAGFELIALQTEVLRQERGQPVHGLLAILKKPASDAGVAGSVGQAS